MRIKNYLIALLIGLGLMLATLDGLADEVTAEQGVAAGGDIRESTITIGLTPEQVRDYMLEVLRKESTAHARVAALSKKLDVTNDAIVGFFRILDEKNVALEKLPEKLAEVAQRHRDMLDRLAVLDTESPEIRGLIEQARTAVKNADYDRADRLLREAETAELAAAQMAEDLARQAQEAAERRVLNAAKILAERGELSLTRLDYRIAAKHFEKASERVPASHLETRNEYLDSYAYALYRQGTEKVDSKALPQAIHAYREILKTSTRAQLPQDWARTQNNLGIALQEQGIRSGGEEGRRLLAEAVAAYRNALQVRTQEALPPQWAQTVENLAQAYLDQEVWDKAAESYTSLLRVFPDDAEAYTLALLCYHEKLFAFDQAFNLTADWLQQHPDDVSVQMNFAETHFTTGRFAKAESRLSDLLAKTDLGPQATVALHALEIATLLALGKNNLIPSKLDKLYEIISAQSEEFTGGWTYSGTKYFISQHKQLNSHRWLSDLLTVLEDQDRKAILAAVETARSAVSYSKSNEIENIR